MAQDEWAYRSATDTVAALAQGQVSSRALVDAAIARIEAGDGAINAVVVRDFERARADAAAADAALAAGDRRPLLGLPITVKESIDVAGLAKTWGNRGFAGFRPEADAVAVARLRAAGAIVLGKTNVAFMLGDWQSFNDVYGTTHNPHDVGRSPGGSSGGSAAALAAGFVPLELGSDFFGSLRNPAGFCGVFAHRPSLDLVPLRGGGTPPRAPVWPSLGGFATLGPMARTAADLRVALGVLAGPDPLTEGRAYRLALPAPRATALAGFRVLLLDSHPLVPTAAEVRAALEGLAGSLGRAGCQVARSSPLLPDLKRVASVFLTFVAAGRDQGGSGGTERARPEVAADDDSPQAAFLRGQGLTFRDYLAHNGARQALQAQMRELFQHFDVVVCPVMPTVAFPHDHAAERTIDVDGVRLPYFLQGMWCTIASLLGLPATVAPLGRSPTSGLPVAAQIIGPSLEDATPLTFAELLEREHGGFVAPRTAEGRP